MLLKKGLAMNVKVVSIMNQYGKKIAEVKEYVSKDSLRGTLTKNRNFKPLDDHFLRADNIHLYCTRDLKTGEKSVLAYSGDAADGCCVAQGCENVKKLIKSIKSGVHVNPYSSEWFKKVFG